MAIDLKKAFEGILKQWGHDILLLRKETRAGNQLIFERHTVRHIHPSAMLPGIDQQMIEGLTSQAERIYYFKLEAIPAKGDMIIERLPNSDSHEEWKIAFVVPFRG